MPKEKPLELVRIPLSQIKPDPKNSKDHDVGLIIESFKRFGYVNPMVLNSDDFLLAGHGRRKALLAMQGDNESPPKNIEAKDDEWIVPVGIGPDFDQQEGTAYRLVDNRSTEAGGYYEPQLIENLIGLSANGGLLGTGYDGDDLDKLIEITGYEIDLEEAFGKVPSGEKAPYRRMAFMLHDKQFEIVDQAIRKARQSLTAREMKLNRNRNGSALAAICRRYLKRAGE